MSIALDNEFLPEGEGVEGGYAYRLTLWMLGAPHGAVTMHASILWESGADLSLAKNRSSWTRSNGFDITQVTGIEQTIFPWNRDEQEGHVDDDNCASC